MRRVIGSITNVVGSRRASCASHYQTMMDCLQQQPSGHLVRNHHLVRWRLQHVNNIRVQPFWSMGSSPKETGKKHRAVERPDIQMPPRQDFTKARDCEQEISQLLNSSSDKVLDSATWVKAEACIQQAIDNDDFNLAFDLLNRMAKDPHAKRELRSDTIYLVVQEWLAAYERYQNAPRGEYTQFMYSPVTVWRKIEGYLQLGIHMETRTMHRILEATALVKSKKWNAPMLAESILERMISLSRQENPDIRPSAYTFNAVIGSWEAAAAISSPKSQLNGAPERGLALLEQLKGLYAAGWGDDLMPDKNTYRRVMNLYAHAGNGDKVEALLQELYELYRDHGHRTLQPTTPMFSLVLYAWSKSNDPDAAERAEMILDRMLEMEKNNVFPGLKVTAFCFNIVMVCWSKQRTKKSAQKSQQIFDRMVALSKTDKSKRPIPGSYAALIQTWSYFDAKKAEDAFWMWKGEHDLGRCDMRMDSRLFSMIIAGWFYSKDPDAAARCDKLLQYALEGNFGPAWDPQPTIFNMTINAYCQRSRNQDIERVEQLLEQMKDLARTSKMGSFPGPSAASYVPVIHALTRLGRAEKAEALLRECFDGSGVQRESSVGNSRERNQSATKKKDLNTKTFNRVLKAWLSKAPVSPEAADRAEALLLKMSDWGVKPNINSFRYVLECRKKIQNEHQGLDDVTSKVSSSQILALLDKEYETGALNSDKSAYLSTRRDLSLMVL